MRKPGSPRLNYVKFLPNLEFPELWGRGGGVILWRSVDNQWDCYFLHLFMLSVFAAAMLEYNNMLHTECKKNVVLKNFGFY